MRLIMAVAFLVMAHDEARAIEVQSYLLGDSVRMQDMSPFYKWNTMVSHYSEQQKVPDSQCNHIAYHPCEILHWKAILAALKNRPFLEQLRTVNDYANAFPYTTPMQNWHQDDYWETPFEFMQVSGNCKDYAIMKYYSLRMLGYPTERLRLIVLKDMNLGGVIHAILGVYEQDKLYILDNQIKQVMMAADIYHYVPIYAINEDAWWYYQQSATVMQ